MGQPGWRWWASPPAAGRGCGGPLPPGNRTRDNLFNRSGERPAIENPIAMGRVQRAESRCALPRLRMPTSRERRIFSTNSASGQETESRSAGSRGSGLGADARCPGLQRFMITKDELGARVLHRSPLRRAPVAPSAQRQDHAQRPRVNQSRTRPDGLAIGPPGAGMPRAGAAPGIEIKHANLFRTIRRAADKRKSERRAAAAIGRVQMLALPALSGALQLSSI